MLASSIRELVAPILREAPPECGIVSLIDVQISDDRSWVTGLVSALREPELALEYLKQHTPDMQKRLGALGLQRMPRLRFRLDDRLVRGDRIDQLLKQTERTLHDSSDGTQQKEP